jgi:uncharacterized protein
MLQLPESQFIISKLERELPASLFYHQVNHTLDVFKMAIYYAEKENVTDNDLKLLLIAALYHDSGYLFERQSHEERSCDLVHAVLPGFGYSAHDIQTICNIIMTTKIPQSAQSLLEKILCDADLDYLGRDDFFATGNLLYCEMHTAGLVSTHAEWDARQIEFLRSHQYFTPTAKALREGKKQENLNELSAKTAKIL